jgi:hypothetical protein
MARQFSRLPCDQWWYFKIREFVNHFLQHLLLGMNPHINLDLGMAAVETVPDGEPG